MCRTACLSVHTGSSSFLYKRGKHLSVMKKLETNFHICIARIKVQKSIDISQYVFNYTKYNICQEIE